MALILGLYCAIALGMSGMELALRMSGGTLFLDESAVDLEFGRALRSFVMLFVLGASGIVVGFVIGYGVGLIFPTWEAVATAVVVGAVALAAFMSHDRGHAGTDASD